MATMREMTEVLGEQLWTGFTGFMNSKPDDLSEADILAAAVLFDTPVEDVMQLMYSAESSSCPTWSELEQVARGVWLDWVVNHLLPYTSPILSDIHLLHLSARN